MNRKQLKKACQPLPPEQVLENLRELYDEGSYDFEDHEANAVKAAINVLKLAWEETREPEHKCSGVTPSDIAVGGMIHCPNPAKPYGKSGWWCDECAQEVGLIH